MFKPIVNLFLPKQKNRKLNLFYAMTRGPRSNQEDCLLVNGKIYQENYICQNELDIKKDFLLVAICDGMGGLKAGEQASFFVSEQLLNLFRLVTQTTETYLTDTLKTIQKQTESCLLPESGTTLAGLIYQKRSIMVFNVGDSRIYRLDKQGIRYISHDHSFVQRLLDTGIINQEEAFVHPAKNIIHFGMGPIFSDLWDKFEVTLFKEICKPPLYYLLCSDGVNDVLRDEEIYNILMPNPIQNAPLLLQNIADRGYKDNTSFIIVEILD
ncbi:MAG: serine/threonine-protein phosphatase [Desulfobacterales bacterium]|nr:serine/threonine-protein phosphatase [Desulfobacterales bacterium]